MTATSRSTWHFQWITSWDEVLSSAFQVQWLQWAQQASNSHVFYHPAMARAWIETYRPLRDIQPLFLVARQENTTVFLPLVLWRRDWKSAWQRLIVPVGYADYDYHDPLVVGLPDANGAPSGFWTAFVGEVFDGWRGRFDQLVMDGVVDDNVVGLTGWYAGETCLYSGIQQFTDTESFLKQLRPSLRQDLGRQQRRLAEHGKVEYHVFVPSEETKAQQSLEILLHFHSQRWPGAYKPPGFHQRLLAEALKAGVLHFSEMRLNGKPISWQFNYVWAGRHYSYLPTFDPEYSRFSPSKLHLLYCYEDSIRRRLEVFDHLRGGESYKAGWSTHARTLRQGCWKQGSFRSCIVEFGVQLKTRLLRLRRVHEVD